MFNYLLCKIIFYIVIRRLSRLIVTYITYKVKILLSIIYISFYTISDLVLRILLMGFREVVLSGAINADVDSRYTVAEIKEAVTRANQRGKNLPSQGTRKE